MNEWDSIRPFILGMSLDSKIVLYGKHERTYTSYVITRTSLLLNELTSNLLLLRSFLRESKTFYTKKEHDKLVDLSINIAFTT